MQLLTPEVVARLGSLEVKARTIVEGLLSGEHRGRRSGFSVDFAEHRSYTPGDDVRHVDWKVFGKRDRLYIRQFEEETRLKAWLVMDVSRSMTYRSEGTPLSKLRYANCLAAAIGWVICQQRDDLGLATFSGQDRRLLPPRSGIAGLREIFSVLEAVEAAADQNAPRSGTSEVADRDGWQALHAIAERIQERAVAFVFTDGFGDVERLLRVLKHFRAKKCDTRLLHVLDPSELSFPFDENIAFESLETFEKRTVLAPSIRAAYLEELGNFLDEIERETRFHHCDYHRVATSEPLDRVLLRVLS